jgi:hypothetical protein
LERPLSDVVSSRRPDFPFLICWANEPWTRAWDGNSSEVLIAQEDSPADWALHARDLLPVISDDRYLRVAGRPLILVYRASRLTNPIAMAETWRKVITDAGIAEPYLCRVESFPDERGGPSEVGFDAAVEFQPDWALLGLPRTPTGYLRRACRSSRSLRVARSLHQVVSYERLADAAMAKRRPLFPWWRCVTPGWDNTARRERRAMIVHGATPERYGEWVRWSASEAMSARNVPAPLLFVNAWNEWSEGCHLEPSAEAGRSYLEAHREALASVTA